MHLKRIFRRLVSEGCGLIVRMIPALRPIHETRDTQTPVYLRHYFWQNILGMNRGVYWPVHFTSRVSGSENIYCGIETCPGYMPGCYVQGIGKIYIGDYTQIAANVGLISANHDLGDSRRHAPSEIRIGRYGWIGMNAMILPGVTLGDFTIVGAGAVVTKSFPEGYCVIGGNPARLIKKIDPANCIEHRSKHEYNGFIPAAKFDQFRARRLAV